jgi:hypothetical protein
VDGSSSRISAVTWSGEHAERRVRHPAGQDLAALVEDRYVVLADPDDGRRGDLLEPVPRVQAALAVQYLVFGGPAAHLLGQPPDGAADPALGLTRPVEPEPGLEPDLRVLVSVFEGVVDPLTEHQRCRVDPVVLMWRRTADRGAEQQQSGNSRWRDQRDVESAAAA